MVAAKRKQKMKGAKGNPQKDIGPDEVEGGNTGKMVGPRSKTKRKTNHKGTTTAANFGSAEPKRVSNYAWRYGYGHLGRRNQESIKRSRDQTILAGNYPNKTPKAKQSRNLRSDRSSAI